MPSRLHLATPGTLLVACLMSPCAAHAQARATWDVGTSPEPPVALRSSVVFALGRVAGLIDGASIPADANWTRPWGIANVRWSLVRSHVLVAPGLEGAGSTSPGAPDLAYGAATVRLGLSGTSHVWLELGAGRLWDSGGIGPRPLALGRLGAALTRGPLSVAVSVTDARVPGNERWVSVPATQPPIDTTGVLPAAPTVRQEWIAGRIFREVRGELDWDAGVIATRLRAGTELNGGSTGSGAWVRAEATAWLSPQIGLVVGVGNTSLPVVQTRPPVGALTLALRLDFGRRAAPAPVPHGVTSSDARFEIHTVQGIVRTLRVRVPHARTVELTADFVDWQVVRLSPAGDGVWETRLAISPGNHRVNLRVDGGPWGVPPGLQSVPDDFIGATGRLHVE